MTSSRLAGDAITRVIKPGDSASLVTEYMPDDGVGAQVINTASSGTVYAGTSSSVQDGAGVPIPAGASVQWTTPGQLWCVAGDDATDNITLIVTGRINSWTPSPEAVAIATASELLKEGIPNVLLGKTLFSGILSANETLDVGQYASLNVQIVPQNAYAVVGYSFEDPSSAVLDQNVMVDGDATLPITYRIPVSGPSLTLVPVAGSPYVVVYGSNRTVPIVGVNAPNSMVEFTVSNPTKSSNVVLLDVNGYSQSVFDGRVTARIRITDTGTLAGWLGFNMRDKNGNLVTNWILSTEEMVVSGTSTQSVATFGFSHPRGAGYWSVWDSGGTMSKVELWLTQD